MTRIENAPHHDDAHATDHVHAHDADRGLAHTADPTGSTVAPSADTGTLDEALERLHASGPEREGWLSNHAPMAVEALVRGGAAGSVHRWLDRYRPKLEDMPSPYERVTEENWHAALGDPRRIADWTTLFARRLDERPWRAVLTTWWPRLLPGIAAGATHPVIRTGHAVRALLADERAGRSPVREDPRLMELAHALGYWAARSQPLPPLAALGAVGEAGDALATVPLVAEQRGGIRDRLAQLRAVPVWPAERPGSPEEAAVRLRELVGAAVHRYASHAHGSPVMLVHAATAPNAVLRTLPALPPEWWLPSLDAAWAASAAVTAAYAPAQAVAPSAALQDDAAALSPRELFARAAAHGDEHTVKFTDTALDVGGTLAHVAALRSIELNTPLF